jgi:hypothetical protein
VRGGRGSAVRGRGNGRPGKDRATKTVEDLDRELEEFMASGSSKEVSRPVGSVVIIKGRARSEQACQFQEVAPAVQNAEDIDMA